MPGAVPGGVPVGVSDPRETARTAGEGVPAPDSNGQFDAALREAVTAQPTVTLANMVAALAGLTSSSSGDVSAASQPDSVSALSASGAASERGAAVLAAGERYLGVPYKWGGTSPDTGFDCSGFVQQAFADIGVSLPRVSIDQAQQGSEVVGGLGNAQPGDLLFWHGSNGRPNHIAIYAGDGQMLEAPSTGRNVHYRDVWRTPDSVRRVL